MILLSLIGAFEPIINVENLKFIIQNMEELTGKKINFVKQPIDFEINLTFNGRHRIKAEEKQELVDILEPVAKNIHKQICTDSMLEMLFNLKNIFILKNFNNMQMKSNLILLGITCMDIYPSKNHEYVFGQSDPERGIAIISAYRLYQKDKDDKKINSRILKVMMHEYGHLMNLNHCKDQCIMSIICSLEELDQRTLYCCKNCSNYIKDNNSKSEFVNNLSET